jgi:SAM-dependent methyltransferase
MKSSLSKLRIEFASRMSGLILDCGSGEGIYHSYLKEHGDIVSLDLDINNLLKLDGNKIRASFLWLPFKNNVFDSLWACAVIEHITENCIPEFIRIVKDGGQIAILTPNRLSPIDLFRRLLRMRNWYSHEGHIRLYSVGELEKFGKVYGEIRFIPILGDFFRKHARLSHSILLYIQVKKLAKT